MVSHFKWDCHVCDTENTAWIANFILDFTRSHLEFEVQRAALADWAVICAKSSEVMESVAVSLYLWCTSLASVFLLRETWLRVVTAQHLFSSDIRQTDRQTDGLLFPSRPAAWCPPPASIRIGLTSVLSPLTYMATRNGAKLPSEQPLGPPWILTSLILPSHSTLFVK